MTPDAPPRPGTEGFGDAARRAVAAAEAEARGLGHETVGTEHLLLGLLASDGGASVALRDAGVTLAAARHKVTEAVGAGGAVPTPGLDPLAATSRAGRAMNRAVRFSHQARAGAVGTGHLLLGVLDVEGRAGQVLRGLSVDVNALRASLADVEDSARPGPRPAPERSAPPPARAPAAPDAAATRGSPPPTCPSCRTDLANQLAYRVVKARSEGLRTRDALLYACGACGTVLGVGTA